MSKKPVAKRRNKKKTLSAAQDSEELISFGFTDYISKPIDDDVLIETIEKHLIMRQPALIKRQWDH